MYAGHVPRIAPYGRTATGRGVRRWSSSRGPYLGPSAPTPPALFHGGGRPLPMGDIAGISGIFPPAVEAWRPLVTAYASQVQINAPRDQIVNFLLAWIQRESGGDPCSYTSLRESGIFQLMPPDNTNVAGTTEAALRAACGGGSGSLTRNLTDAEANLQVSSGIQYVNWAVAKARAKLAAAGVSWPDDSKSFFSFVKLQHAYPGPSQGWLQGATALLGHPPTSFGEMRSTVSGYSSVLENADWVGQQATGVGISSTTLLLGGGLVLLYYLWRST